MAGRGCTVCITILGGTDTSAAESVKNEELRLPVALHSPLSVLKEQLADLTGIDVAAQVIILCDLSDVERNNDKLLEGRDYMSLRDCGIKNGSVMTLHALGLSAERYAAERKLKMQKAAGDTTSDVCIREEDRKRTLETPITTAKADHSYNGVLFDVKCNGPFEVDLLSVSVGGMLGRVRIFARDRPCEADRPTQGSSPHWWAHRESVSNVGWTVVADVICRPSWDKPLEIKFDHPVTLLPHTQRGLYCHSSLPDDLGIQYQSYRSKESIVACNEHITLLAGLGHTGSVPFDEQQGWYRAWRGLSGTVSYKTKWKGWSPLEHRLFPQDLRYSVRVMLMCQNRVIQDTDADAVALSELKSCHSSSEVDKRDLSKLQLHLLPKFLIYNILEFMHWDWFENLENKRGAVERAKMHAARALLGRDRSMMQRSNCFPGPITVPLSMLSDMNAAGQEHQMMLMIAQAIAAGQEEIIIGGMVLQLNQEVADDEEEAEDTEVTPSNLLSGLLLNQQTSEFDEEFEHADEADDDDDEDDDDEDEDYVYHETGEHGGLMDEYNSNEDHVSDSEDDDDSSSEGISDVYTAMDTATSAESNAGRRAMHVQEDEDDYFNDVDEEEDEDNGDVVSLT